MWAETGGAMETATPVIAHGFDLIWNSFAGMGAVVMVCVGTGVLVVCCLAFKNAFRFGKQGISWQAIRLLALHFSAGACFLVGLPGLFFGLPVLIPFQIGRCRRQKNVESQPS